MFFKLSSKPNLKESNERRGGRGSWRDKLTWLSRYRETSQNSRQAEPGFVSKAWSRSLDKFSHHERSSAATMTKHLISSREVQSENDVQANDRLQASNILQDSEDVQANNSVQAKSIVVDLEDATGAAVSQDVWNTSYREAILSFGDELKSDILMGESIGKLLTSLEETNEELAGDSLFRRGLRRLQVPLRSIKLALDVARPVVGIEPAASTAVGAVSSVTAVAIAICGAEDSLNTRIITMLEQISIIDECDTLGRKLDAGNAIQKALVPVYRDLLKFYMAALDILTSKTFVLALVCDQLSQRIPAIVSDFLEHATLLRSRIGNATLELITDIKRLLQEDKIQKLLGVNKDKQRSEFHCENRRLRVSAACNWIVEDSKFLNWYNAPASEQLILLGNMGSGKTVITAHVIEDLIRRNKSHIPRSLLCYHYCKDNETGQALYIYSSLILQLLDQQEGFKLEFDKWYDDTKKSQHFDPAQSSMDLADFFSTCVRTLDRELFIVIDGLDECDSRSQNDLVTMLNNLSKQALRLKVFLSSRPLEGIESLLHATNQIRWIPSQERDNIMVQHVVERCLNKLDPDIQSLVSERLSKLAQGSAIWVKFTTELIKRRKIKASGPMRTFLANIILPQALSQLYAKLFAQLTGDDLDNVQLATSALEILAVARRPLSILELGWALALIQPSAGTQTMDELKDHVDANRALSLLQPFLSQVDFQDVKGSQVRLVHQSLKVLILQRAPSTWAQFQDVVETSWTDSRGIQQRQPKLEAALLQLCVKYLLLDEFDEMDLFSKEQETAQALESLPEFGLFDDYNNENQQTDSSKTSRCTADERKTEQIYYDPTERGFGGFFVYASCFWVDHFNKSASECLRDTSDIVKLCRARSKRLQNWIGQNCRPDCTIMPKFDYDSDLQDPLVVTSLCGPEIALKKLLQEHDVVSKDFLTDSVKQAVWQISRYGDISRLQILFRDTRNGPAVRNLDFFHQLMTTWAQSDRESTQWVGLFDLVIDIFDVLVKEEWGNELLCMAASFGCLPIIERLFEEATRNPALRDELLRDLQRDYRGTDHHQSVGEAAWYNHVETLDYLLKQEGIEVHLRHRNRGGYNVLHKTARYCNPEIVSLLVSHFREGVNQTNNVGETPLCLVIFEASSGPGRIASAEILLTLGGADVRGGYTREPSHWNEPLRMAARYGDVAMCHTLVEIGGADPRRVLKTGDDGRPSLIDYVESEELAPRVLETLCSLAGMD